MRTTTAYVCDFCSKVLRRKPAMEVHESKCMKNPENNRRCLDGCKFLERETIEYDSGESNYYTGETIFREAQAFICRKFGKLMLHPKISQKESAINLRNVYLEGEEETQQDMPKECDEFLTASFDEVFNL